MSGSSFIRFDGQMPFRKPSHYPNLSCSLCGKELMTGEFFAAIGELPQSGRFGRTDIILADLGAKLYCKNCFELDYICSGNQ